jgi:hypothetical protein
MDRVAELEQQLKEAKRVQALELHSLALDTARALDHGVPWINHFFKERAQLEHVITTDAFDAAMGNRLQGGNYSQTQGFTITIKDTSICVVMVVGQKKGGWRPFKSQLDFQDCKNPKRRKPITAGNQYELNDMSSDWFDMFREAFQNAPLTPLSLTQWISALESFISEYLRVTKQFSLPMFSGLFSLALISNDAF